MSSADAPPPARRARLRTRWVVLALVVIAIVVGLRLLAGAGPAPQQVGSHTDHLVVVGVEGRFRPDATDRAVIGRSGAQVGAMAVRATKLGECSAAGWSTLGAGRRATVDGLCTITTTDLGVVYDWRARQAAASSARSDARLGTLSQLATADGGDCIASVGPGAALAAANPDGTNTAYLPVDAYIEGGFVAECPITLVDAGARSDEVIAGVAKLADTTVVVTGIGPKPGSHDPNLQAVYRLGGDTPGWLTSSSTRRTGIITLTDLTRAIIDFAHHGTGPAVEPPVLGAPLEVVPAQVDASALAARLRSIQALSDTSVSMYIEIGVVGLAVAVALVVSLWRRRRDRATGVLTVGAVWSTTMMLVGFTRWWRTDAPLAVLSAVFWPILAGLAALVWWVVRRTRLRRVVVAAGVSAAAFTVEALTGGLAEPGSLLNSRPVESGRWYGFGNVTFSAYAAPIVLVAGAGGEALPTRPGRRVPGLWRSVGVLAIGFALVVCEGWPTMGSDFGGVLVFTPITLWLALMVSGLRPRWWAYPVIAAAAVAVVSGVAVLDWLRPPNQRSHLGRFVQSILDGGAVDIVLGKLVMMVDSIISPMGIVSVIVGIPVWWAIFHYGLPHIRLLPYGVERPDERRIVTWTGVAALATAIIGTLLNDGGSSVWLTTTGCFTVLVALGLVDRLRETHILRGRQSS